MQVYTEPGGPLAALDTGLELANGSVVGIGVFDGVHLGHREILRTARLLAVARDASSGAVTFARHPASVLRPEAAPLAITDLDTKLELLSATGVDFAAVLAFDDEHAREPAEDFVRRVLVDGLAVRAVVVGEDFHFGHQRRGDVAMLTQLGAEHGFEVIGLPLVDERGGATRRGAATDPPVSSTWVRASIADGDMETAHALLGRPHELRGTVVRGDQRGRTWGFPTANVAVAGDTAVPAAGIYAGWLVLGGGKAPRKVLNSAVYIGSRPTVYGDEGDRVVEVHVLDFDGDIYDEPVRVRFGERLRGDERFASFDELQAQIGRDVESARRWLMAVGG